MSASATALFTGSLIAITVLVSPLRAKEYSSAELRTKESYRYGRFEVRMKSAQREGMLSSFFTYNDLNPTWNEIDIEILGRYPDDIQFTTITPGQVVHPSHYQLPFNPHLGYHTYGFEWTPEYVAWIVDGQEVYRQQGLHIATLNQPQKIMMNVWNPDPSDWTGKWNEYVLPGFADYDWVSYASYTPSSGTIGTGNNFSPQWKDNFDSLDTSRWDRATHTWAGNQASMTPANNVFHDGHMTLCLTTSTLTGYFDNVAPTPTWGRWEDGKVTASFSEEIDSLAAVRPGGFLISSATISSPELLPDLKSVRFSASGVDTSTTNALIVLGMKDRFQPPNLMAGKSIQLIVQHRLPFPVKINCGGPATGDFLADTLWDATTEYGRMDGRPTAFSPSLTINGTGVPEIYRTQLTGAVRYRVRVPSGRYNVTLMFAENAVALPGVRTFRAYVQGKRIPGDLDIFSQAGSNRAFLLQADTVHVTEGFVEIHLMALTGETMLSGLVIEPSSPTAVRESDSQIPRRFDLRQNFPNPFNPSTTITYVLPKTSYVSLTVYDMLGREVSVLVNEMRDAGIHEVKFSAYGGYPPASIGSTRRAGASGRDGSGLASGVYFYRIQAEEFVMTKRLMFLK